MDASNGSAGSYEAHKKLSGKIYAKSKESRPGTRIAKNTSTPRVQTRAVRFQYYRDLQKQRTVHEGICTEFSLSASDKLAYVLYSL